MDQKRREINHEINMQYRQLGKLVFGDLKNDRLNVSKYKRRAKKIEQLIRTIHLLEVEMDNVEDLEEPDEILEEMSEPVTNEDGIQVYRFCPKCNAGNHPEAKTCIRCGEPM